MDETWVEETDWSKVRIGDRVQVRRDENVITGTVDYGYANRSSEASSLTVKSAALGKSLLVDSASWSLFVPARSAGTLPTEPGVYFDKDEDVWRLSSMGDWEHGGAEYLSADHAKKFAPFTRLELVPDTARRVLQAIKETYEENYLDNGEPLWNKVVAEFGVTDL